MPAPFLFLIQGLFASGNLELFSVFKCIPSPSWTAIVTKDITTPIYLIPLFTVCMLHLFVLNLVKLVIHKLEEMYNRDSILQT